MVGGQVLGGGVIVLVAVTLWLVYLLPSWHSRRQFDAVQRNAVRLNQALRVLAETSQTPDEVHVELNTRTARAQQKLARRAQAEREREARHAQAERDRIAKDAQAENERMAAQAVSEREAARLMLARAELEKARAERAAAARLPHVRRARARRRARLAATVLGLAALALVAVGAVIAVSGGSVMLLAGGVGTTMLSALLLVQMARVAAHSRARAVPVQQAPAAASAVHHRGSEVADLPVGRERGLWQPRPLPQPLTASVGSQAALVLNAADAREQLRQAALDEPLRARALEDAPASLDTARLAQMGHVDDAEIEEHVRHLLRARAVS